MSGNAYPARIVAARLARQLRSIQRVETARRALALASIPADYLARAGLTLHTDRAMRSSANNATRRAIASHLSRKGAI